MFVVALVFVFLQASPGRVFAQTDGTWTSGTGVWSGTARWSGGTVAGGTNATATFTLSGGTATLTGNIVLGNITTLATSPRTRINATTAEEIQFATTTGTAPTVTNAGRTEFAAVIAGSQGYKKAGAGDLYIWAPNTYAGTTTISSGRIRLQSFSSPSGLGATGAGNGTVVESAGTLMLDGGVTVGDEPLTISGTGNANQGSLRQQSGNGTFSGPITLAGNGKVTAASNAGLALTGSISLGGNSLEIGDAGSFTVSGWIAGTGNVDYTGTGGLVLSGLNTFSGTTTVTNAGGAVAMNGYLTGPMNFAGVSGRNLIGTGTFGGGATVGANTVLAPGAAAAVDYGTLTASTLEVQSATVLLGIQDASTYDRLVMTAPAAGLTLGGTASLVLDFATELSTSSLNLLSFSGLSGGFDTVSSTGAYAGTWTPAGGAWTLANAGAGGNQTLTYTQSTGVLAIVPEPSTLVLLGGCALVVASRVCRRRRFGTADS
jgi:autotransporter-associated beta strand protein